MHPNQATHNYKSIHTERLTTLSDTVHYKNSIQHRGGQLAITDELEENKEKQKQKNHCNTEPEEKDMVLTVVSVDTFRSLVYLTYDLVQCVTEETVKIS